MTHLRAPFPWFGGKSRASEVIWRAFGDVPNYVEPFAGSLAVLLGRPHAPRLETVNDKDSYVSNFWRALAADPDAVAEWADWPVNEADLSARHQWLVDNTTFRDRMAAEPDFFDAKVAGWWVWGLCLWIGSGWCDLRRERLKLQLPHLGNAGRGVHRQLPHLGNAGMGVHRQLPHLGNAGRGIADMCAELSERLRRVRVCCGDWSRVLGPTPTVKQGVTAILLDPPYSDEHRGELYAQEDFSVAADVARWVLEHGENPDLRIALCGYEGEHDLPGWRKYEWKTQGGYGGQSAEANENARRERIWFSPGCLEFDRQLSLLSVGGV